MPKVSILIPVFNREGYIGDCIKSAVDQTVEDIEIVVVDNASTDNTWAICEEWASKDNRIKIFRNKENVGPVLNWVASIDKAQGDYGKLLFSDDKLSPDYLEKALPLLNDETAFVISAVQMGESEEASIKCHDWPNEGTYIDSEKYIYESLLSFGVLVSPGAALFRLNDLKNNLMQEIPSPSMKDFKKHGAGPDLLIFLLTAKQYPKIAQLDESLAFFREHNNSATIKLRKTKEFMINSCYMQARMWFAEKHTSKRTKSMSAAKAWLVEVLENRNLACISPFAIFKMYLDDAKNISWFYFGVGVVNVFCRAVSYKVKRDFLRKI